MATAIRPPRPGKDRVERGGGHAVGRRLLDRVERQRHQVREVGEQVDRDDQGGAQRQRQREGAARVLYLARGERDVVPRVGGEQRPVCATQIATNSPKTLAADSPGTTVDLPARRPGL
jgi:hypothetical protein